MNVIGRSDRSGLFQCDLRAKGGLCLNYTSYDVIQTLDFFFGGKLWPTYRNILSHRISNWSITSKTQLQSAIKLVQS